MRWSDEASEQADADAAWSDGLEQSLEGPSAMREIGSWNQFEANERLYGAYILVIGVNKSFNI